MTFKNPTALADNIQKPKRTVGEDLADFYNDAFFKQANGDRDAFIKHHIDRFGIPRGSSRVKETKYYGDIFDKMAKERGVTPIDPNSKLDDYDLFKKLYYPAWTKGRDNYLEGEEEKMYEELNKYFDLPPFQKASKENGYEGNVFLVNPGQRTISIKRGTQSLPLKRR